MQPRYVAATTIVGALVLGVGSSFAAERALPGEWLYPVKVGVNEKVRTAFTFNAASRARWQTALAERRLNEAEALAVAGRLEGNVQQDLAARFAGNAESVRNQSAQLTAEGNVQAAAEVDSRFEASLRAHQKLMSQVKVKNPAPAVEVNVSGLLNQVNAALEATVSNRTAAEASLGAQAKPEVQVAAENKLQAAENKLVEVQAFLTARYNRLSAEAKTEAEAQLSAAQNTIARGKASLAAEAYGEAFAHFQAAHRAAQETKLIIQGHIRLDLPLGLEVRLTPSSTPTPSPSPTPAASVGNINTVVSATPAPSLTASPTAPPTVSPSAAASATIEVRGETEIQVSPPLRRVESNVELEGEAQSTPTSSPSPSASPSASASGQSNANVNVEL